MPVVLSVGNSRGSGLVKVTGQPTVRASASSLTSSLEHTCCRATEHRRGAGGGRFIGVVISLSFCLFN